MVRDINFNEYIDDLCGRRRCRCLGSSDVYHFRYVDGVQKVSNEGISNATMLIKETKEIKEREGMPTKGIIVNQRLEITLR